VAIDIRMVKNQTRKKVYGRLLEHIRAQGFTVLAEGVAYVNGERAKRGNEKAAA